LLKPQAFPADNTYMATSPIAAKGAANVTGPKPATPDLATLLAEAGPMTTKADLANVLKSIAPGALADAVLNKQPGTEGVTAEFANALADALKADPHSKRSTVAHERIGALSQLAKSLAPAPAAAPAAKDEVGAKVKTTQTAGQRAVDAQRTAESQKSLAKASKGLGFDVAEQPAKTDGADAVAASNPAELSSAVQSAKASLEKADALLQSLPQQFKKQTAFAMNGYGKVPSGAMGAYQQAMAALNGIDQSVAKLSTDDQKAFYAEFGINYDVSMQLTEQAKANPPVPGQPGLQAPAAPNLNSGNSAADMSLGSRVSPLNRTQLLPLSSTTPMAPAQDSRARPPSTQLKDIVVSRLSFAGIQPTNLAPITWDNPQAQPAALPYDNGTRGIIEQLGQPNVQNAAAWNQRADALTGAQAQALSANGAGLQNVMSGDEMRQLLAKKDTNPAVLAQQIIAQKSPMQSRLTQDAVGALIEGFDPGAVKTKAEAQQYVNLIQGLKDLMPSLPVGVGAMPPGYQMQPGYQTQPGSPMPQGTMPYGMFGNSAMTGAMATMGAGFMPTGNTGFDLANAVASAPAFSPAEQSLLSQIQDPQQYAMQALQMFMQKQALLATTLSNIANMRHEMMKTVANNLRG
jgi:hypothetical protein